jgi:uncharacterized protein
VLVALEVIGQGLKDSLLMGWQIWWALVLGFSISAIVQAWAPRASIEAALSGGRTRPVALATALGAASSSCSYAAVAIAKSLFDKGASAVTAVAFQIASTNIVWELGLVLWTLIGWQFTVAEYLGGLLMIMLVAIGFRSLISPRLERRARAHALRAGTGHRHHVAGEAIPLSARLTSLSSWSDVAHNFRGDWQMLYREIAAGLLLAGFVAQIGDGFFTSLFLEHNGGLLATVENAVVGPLIAALSFVCSVGNVPLAAVLWSAGIGFAGVLSFLFADLIVLPIVAIYRKYYGTAFALRLVVLLFVAMVVSALAVDGLFSLAGLTPSGVRPSRSSVFGSVGVDYKLFLNILGLVIFAALFALTLVRGATDPVCEMRVDRAKAVRRQIDGKPVYFCSEHCARVHERAHAPASPESGVTSSLPPARGGRARPARRDPPARI